MTEIPPPPPPTYVAPVAARGQLGKVRSTPLCILLAFVTLGIYVLVWYFMVHEEMKRHSGRGLGGIVALLIAFFVGIVSPYLTSHEVGELYAVDRPREAGQRRHRPLVLPRRADPDRPVHLVHQDERRAERLLEVDGRAAELIRST